MLHSAGRYFQEHSILREWTVLLFQRNIDVAGRHRRKDSSFRDEVYTAVGLGAFWLPNERLLFLSSIANAPDKGISRALQLLGFDFKETATDSPTKPPYDQLRSDL